VLILPPGHGKAIHVPRRFSSREKWMIGAVVGAVAAILVAVVIALALPGPKSSRGCIYLTIAGPVGAQYLDHCGAAARDACSTAANPRANQGGAALIAECRKAGLPVGR
jgi:hypothetical protein